MAKSKAPKKSEPAKTTEEDKDPQTTSPDLEATIAQLEEDNAKLRTEIETTKSAGELLASTLREEIESAQSKVEATIEATSEPVRRPREEFANAAYKACIEHGMSERDAHRVGESLADRMRIEDDFAEDVDFAEEFEEGVEMYDLRHEQDYQYPGGARKAVIRGNAAVMRSPKEVDTIVLHQTAIEFGVSKYAIRKSGGDVELARARRALDVACHTMAFRKGYFVAAHPMLAYLNHGNRFNGRSVGLEIEGLYPGLADDPMTVEREDLETTWKGEPTVLTEETVAAARNAILFMMAEVARLGGKITRVVSHRQSNDARRSDPGQEIWQRIAVDFCQNELGLTLDLLSPWKHGRDVPLEWDENGRGSY